MSLEPKPFPVDEPILLDIETNARLELGKNLDK
jgi:hypothetical protein